MATRRNPPKPAKGKAASGPKEKKVKEVKEIKPGPPVESVLAVVTGLMLLASIVLVDFVKGRDYGTGMFFKGEYSSTK